MMIFIYLTIATVVVSLGLGLDGDEKYLLRKMNDELLRINRLSAKLEWESSTKPSREIFQLKRHFSWIRSSWRNEICSRLNYYSDGKLPYVRMIYLLCRGPSYSSEQARALTTISDDLVKNYAIRKVCKMEIEGRKCYHGEPELKTLMVNSRNESELLWAWTSWRNEMSVVKELFTRSIDLQNIGARNNGYNNIGECWREELEIPNLENFVDNLYKEVQHLYRLLHAVVRFRLGQTYPGIVRPDRPIPAHLLEKNFTESHCHATAANMFENEDYRIIACLDINANDFYVIHHEIGHIQYYMAYEKQPTIFRNGVNSAFHEAIGDSVMLGVMTSQHLQRLGLAEDAILTDDLSILLRQALAKLPEIPHALLMDKWRWRIFESEKNSSAYNALWWKLQKHYMGIESPSPRDDNYFDPAAKFHIVSNTPYIRYYIANILQYQLFDAMCEAAITGKVGDPEFSMKLHRCDIYGSKKAAKRLRSMMSRGRSVDWRDWIRETTGKMEISASSLLRYYEPVKIWLENEVKRHRIPIGWK